MPNLLLRTIAASLSFAVFVLSGQVAGASFEVATIHPAAASETIAQQIQQGKLHVGMSIGPARVDIGFLSVGDMIPIAYRVTPYEVTGPEWMKTAHWDIVAKMPEGATKDQVPEMLQALLTDRFKLRVHKEIKEQNVYALVVGKEGPRLKDAAPIAGAPATNSKDLDVLSTSQGSLSQSVDGKTVTVSGNSLGLVRVTMPSGPSDLVRVEINVGMAVLADLLSTLINKPVVNMTQLQGSYEVSLELPSYDAKGVMRVGAGIGMLSDNASADHSVDAVFEAVGKLGLRLEARKVPVNMIVVDSVEKTPTVN